MTEQQRRSIMCPQCNRLISMDEENCPYCGVTKPGSWWRNNMILRGNWKEEELFNGVIAFTILLYLFSVLLDRNYFFNALQQMNVFQWFAPSGQSLYLLGATGSWPLEQGRWWTLWSANFLHANLLHIIFNMSAFYSLAPMIREEYGVHRSFLIYIWGGVIGFWVSHLVKVALTVGASAAICAWVGALLYYGYARGGAHGKKLFQYAVGWIFSLALMGVLVSQINHWAHFGGLIGGIILGMLLRFKESSAETNLLRIFSLLTGLLTIGILLYSVFSTLSFKLS